jgi:RNA polymerase sigma-70 factor (ECF subfamily)
MAEGSLPDNELIRLLNKGDILAFDTIYKRYCRRLYGFIFRFLKSREDSEEIVQEVFLKIWEAQKKIDSFHSFDSFVFTIAYNSAISLLRKRITEQKYLDQLKLRQWFASSPDLIDEIQFRELEAKVDDLLNNLTPRQREIYRLSREQGFSRDEIAEKLKISSNTVKNHLVTALAYLKSELNNGLLISILFVDLFF